MAYTADELKGKKVAELRDIAKDIEHDALSGYSSMRKDELVKALVTALGVGLASSIKGRNPMVDGFGLIAFASLTPMIFVMGYGMVV